MKDNICLVEVLILKKKKGEEFWLGDLENDFHIFETEDYFIELPEKIKEQPETVRRSKIGFAFVEPDIQFIKDVDLFQFRFFGQNLDGEYANGLDFEYSQIIGHEIFEGWENELAKLGDQLLMEYEEKGIKTKGLIRFVTIWKYDSWQDSYYNEFESEWDLIGLLNMDKLTQLT